jgi:uncharacterized protein (TIGR02598 family)
VNNIPTTGNPVNISTKLRGIVAKSCFCGISPRQVVRRRLGKALAFSLVEVALALGIFSFAVVSVMGLMPVGLSAARKAMRTSQEMQITAQILNSLQATPFANLQNFTGQYSADGAALSGTSGASYFVSVVIVPSVKLPTTILSASDTSNLASVQMTFRSLDNVTNSYTTTIANTCQ